MRYAYPRKFLKGIFSKVGCGQPVSRLFYRCEHAMRSGYFFTPVSC